MKRLLAVSGLALVAFVPAAQAKEIDLLRVGGASGCKALRPAVKLAHTDLAGASVPGIGPYYVLTIGYADGGRIFQRGAQYFVAAAGAIAAKDGTGPSVGWSRLPDAAADAVRRGAAGLQPFPAPRPSRVYVGAQRVADPGSYATLLGPLEEVAVPRTQESPITIGLGWARQNPWSTTASLEYLPRARVLIRFDGFFRVPD